MKNEKTLVAPKKKVAVEKYKFITVLQLQKLLMDTPINGGTFISLITNTEEKNLKNAKTCALAGLRKITQTVAHVYAHHQYENQMRKIDPTFVSKPRVWGVRLKDRPLLEHKGKYYLEVFFDNGRSKTRIKGYFLNGSEIPKETVSAAMLPRKEEEICYRNYALDSIMEIKFNGQRYKIII